METFLNVVGLDYEKKGKSRSKKAAAFDAVVLDASPDEKRYLRVTYQGSFVFVAIQKKSRAPSADGLSDDSTSGRVYMAAVCDKYGQPAGGKLYQLGVHKDNELLRREQREARTPRLIFERAVKKVDGEWVWCTPGVGDLSDFILSPATKEEFDDWESGADAAPAAPAPPAAQTGVKRTRSAAKK